MKPIIIWELKLRKSYLFWWTISTCGLIALLLLVYPSIHAQADQLNKVLSQLPASLRDLKTGGSQIDITSPIGYLHSQLYYVTLPLLQIIMAVGLGSSLIARDEQNHTLELLLARPLSRGKLLAAKALSGLIMVLSVSLIATIVTVILARLVGLHIATAHLVLTSLYTTLFSLSFGVIAFGLTAASNATRRLSMAAAVALSFGGYLLASLSGLSHYLETPAKFLPYHYFKPSDILAGHVAVGLNIYLVTIAVGLLLISWLGFRHRDIY